MAIQLRRGAISDLDTSRLLPGEYAICTDGTIIICYAPTKVKTLASKEDIEELLNLSPDMYQALLELEQELANNPTILDGILSAISELKTEQDTLNAKQETLDSKMNALEQSQAQIVGNFDSKADTTIISDAWLSSKTYSVGEYCIYNNTMWKCLTQNKGTTPVAGTYWTPVTVGSEIDAVVEDMEAEINDGLPKLLFSGTQQSGTFTLSDTDWDYLTITFVNSINSKVVVQTLEARKGERIIAKYLTEVPPNMKCYSRDLTVSADGKTITIPKGTSFTQGASANVTDDTVMAISKIVGHKYKKS